MTVCHSILTPVIVLIRTLVRTAREVVRTVCDWVSSTITTVKTIVERVCSWLPWPLNELCNLVTRVIEVIETVWNWVCHDVIETIFEWIERIVEYVAYIVRWICWVVAWVVRGPALLLCVLGLKQRRFLHICIQVLTDEEGRPAVEWSKVDSDLRQAQAILDDCNLQLVVTQRHRVSKPEFLDGTTCEFSGMFSDFFTWFSANECGGCAATTVYYVRSIPGAIGCAYPGTNWVTVASRGDGRTLVQEIGHLADLWAHSSDPDNVMTDQGGGTADQVTSFQCCVLRTSRFSSALPCRAIPKADLERPDRSPRPPIPPEAAEPRGSHARSHAFQRSAAVPGTGQKGAQASGMGAAAGAVLLLAWLARRRAR